MEKDLTYTITEKNAALVEIKAEIAWNGLAPYRKKALNKLQNSSVVPGFRPGKTPENILIRHVGEEKILYEMVNEALSDAYDLIIKKELLRPLVVPSITTNKLVVGEPFTFIATVQVFPTLSVPDYRKIAVRENLKKEEVKVEDKEINEALENLRKEQMRVKNLAALPKEDDDFAKSLGNFKDLADLREKIKESLLQEKTRRAKDKKRSDILEGILSESGVPAPETFVEETLEDMVRQFKQDVARMGVQFKDYLTQIKKTEADIRKEWHKEAERRVQFELLLAMIAEKEKLEPTPEEVAAEMKHFRDHHHEIPAQNMEGFIKHQTRNSKVLTFLENLK